jgi:hypothetical protein
MNKVTHMRKKIIITIRTPANIATANMTKTLVLDFINIDDRFSSCIFFLLQHRELAAVRHRVTAAAADGLVARAHQPHLAKAERKSLPKELKQGFENVSNKEMVQIFSAMA